MNENENILTGRNPVTEALRSGRPIDKLMVQTGAEGSVKVVLGLAGERGIPVHFVKRAALDRVAGQENHQGVVAFVASARESSLDDMLALAERRGEPPFLVLLDGIEDPHNLGAIIRTAECAGAHGVLLPKRHSAGMTDTVARTSAGAVEYLPWARVTNLTQTIDHLKSLGIWVVACDMDGGPLYASDLRGPLALVIGGEGSGIGRLVRSRCDFAVRIPMKGRISSLNASNAAAVLMYEAVRQRNGNQP